MYGKIQTILNPYSVLTILPMGVVIGWRALLDLSLIWDSALLLEERFTSDCVECSCVLPLPFTARKKEKVLALLFTDNKNKSFAVMKKKSFGIAFCCYEKK